ncbi:MAG: DNA repair protein RecN [Chitinophagales bacterium]
MLSRLYISNYAIINAAEISFSGDLNIITGETGAGKSILLGALNLLAGARADSRVLYDKKKKCIVEGHFVIAGYGLEDFFTGEGIDYDAKETIIRRELSDSGKSRAFINDTPVNVTTLQQLADKLITIHSQHETLALGDSSFQRMVVDALSGNDTLLQQMHTAYTTWKACADALHTAETEAQRAVAEIDYMQFQFDELEAAGLDDVDQNALEDEQSALQHAEEIQRNVFGAVEMLENAQGNITDALRDVINNIRTVSNYNKELSIYVDRLEQSAIELRDISRDLDAIAAKTQSDPNRLESLQNTLSAIYRLQKKHNTQEVSALIALRNELQEKIHAYRNSEETLEKLRKEKDKLYAQACLTAKKLSAAREKGYSTLESSVKKLLAETGMRDAQLQVEHQFDTDQYLAAHGADNIRYLFSANAGSALQDIKKVASGGELSRLMLCIKSLLAKTVALPTLIFDEIDTGVSGAVAEKVGNILLGLAKNHQVVAITHLPQIASKGTHHLYVYKESDGKETHTHIRTLNKDERLHEIAKMLSGEKPTKAALENAKELLQ